MTFASILAKVPILVRTVLVSIFVAAIVYGIGFCSGNEHGAASQRVKQLEAQSDSLARATKAYRKQYEERERRLNLAISAATKAAEQRTALMQTVRVVGPGKVQVIVKGEPKVVPIPESVTALLAADSVTITEIQQALIEAQARIVSLKLQVEAERNLAVINAELYEESQKIKKGSGGFILGFLLGAGTITGLLLIAK